MSERGWEGVREGERDGGGIEDREKRLREEHTPLFSPMLHNRFKCPDLISKTFLMILNGASLFSNIKLGCSKLA